jgi:hypothetical protein
MRTRFFSFIIFQLIAWTIYFKWEIPVVQQSMRAEKSLEIAEISPQNVSNRFAYKNNYRLILRNDGFYTRINQDNTFESGLWKVNYDMPAIILSSPRGDNQYQIITNSNDKMNVRKIISSEEFTRNMDETNDLKRLFSSSSLQP